MIAILIGSLLRSSRGAHLIEHFPQCCDFSHKALKKGVNHLQRVQAQRLLEEGLRASNKLYPKQANGEAGPAETWPLGCPLRSQARRC